ncbi:MAG: heme ABC exporter ATP-binding protein CcmA [Candidatus Firestonebacteria bacterium]|nr:heme ABC exporter ATP-binding protein CcmA [Candidatus Firestonebacteria bacterium]
MVEAVRVKNISKSFPVGRAKNPVLVNISFSLKAGELLVVTGKNGSGKTTLLKIMAGLLFPDSGQILLQGLQILKKQREAKRLTGFMGSEERTLYWKLTGRQNLEFYASLYNIDSKTVADRIEKLALRLELQEFLDKPVEDCSLGMKQRISIARCLLPHPQILLFDEPLKGLDRRTKEIFLELLETLREKNYTVIITTHNLEDFRALRHKRLELAG